nr:EthD superfamily protein [Xylaria schweinitzii]
MSSSREYQPAVLHSEGQFLCVTICGYKKGNVSDEDFHHYMAQVCAPLGRDLMMKYGIVRFTQRFLHLARQIYNTTEIRAAINQLYDPTLTKLADFDLFSQIVFKKLEDFRKFKQDPIYKTRLTVHHDDFVDTKRSM